ncbi:hypothetical protein LZ32DRAFT_423223 [Colletotrichum eremochloae]|nr:hypothetical protein LZ32DRAFT_423223 [Colletotrichum eremochloae]
MYCAMHVGLCILRLDDLTMYLCFHAVLVQQEGRKPHEPGARQLGLKPVAARASLLITYFLFLFPPSRPRRRDADHNASNWSVCVFSTLLHSFPSPVFPVSTCSVLRYTYVIFSCLVLLLSFCYSIIRFPPSFTQKPFSVSRLLLFFFVPPLLILGHQAADLPSSPRSP